MAAIQIRDVRVFLTAPDDQNLVAVRVDTTEPGLYGLGCATLAYRAFAVKDVVERSLKPLLLGRDVCRVQDLWNLMMQNAYWRNGPVLNNAVSGVDMALWDIKAKAAGMPLFDLLGGKCRDRVDVYRHCNAASKQQVLELAQQAVDSGCKYIRAAYTAYDGPGEGGYLCLANQCKVYDPGLHRKNIVDLLEALRVRFGDAIALMTDTHERLSAQDAVKLAKALEPLDLLFMEDPVAPEQKEWLARIRQVCATPLAMGELQGRGGGRGIRRADGLARVAGYDAHRHGGADPSGLRHAQFWHTGILWLRPPYGGGIPGVAGVSGRGFVAA